MFPSLKLETRKRKQAIANGNLPVITVRKQVAMKPGFAGSLSSSTSTSDTQPVLPQPRKVIRVIHKSNVIKPANDARPMQAATATVTVARPINLMDIMGEMSNAASTSTAVHKTMDVNNSRTIDVNPAMASTSFAIPVLTNQKVENDSEECSGDHDDSTKDPSCQKCISQLPAIRKSLVRLESRLDTMLTMARTLLARAHTNQNQFGQRPVYTINTKTRVLFPPPTPTDSIPTVSNVKIVKKISDLTGGRKPSWPAPKKLI
ncbi:unnamed protein product [Auanema sp. JU1783]|nr:unnamed protein product [Auanema sp. JU1783]